MRHITISVLSLLIVMPTVASARLPVVNIASGGVSARSAFGEGVTDTSVASGKSVAFAEKTQPQSTRKKTVVARTAKKIASPQVGVETGAEIIASNDILAPRRPSNDLWARNDSSLRMPRPNEFFVMRSDAPLPEENIDSATSVATVSSRSVPALSPLSEIDSQIARLNDLQRRADDSVRNVSNRVIAAPIADSVPDVPVRVASNEQKNESENVSLRRMVVPMTDDVIVRSVEKNTSPRIVAVRDDMTKMTPAQLRQAFRKTFLSENKHLSTYAIDDRFDVASDMSSTIEGFTAQHDISEGAGIRPLEIKIKFRNEDSALSRENYNLLTEYAGIVVSKPTRAIQLAIPEYMTQTKDGRKLAARRLAIVEQVLTDNGVSQQRIVPVLSNRNESGFVLRIISSDQYDTLTQQKRDIFGDTIGKKTYKSMSW
ncbi:MAG: hypothetical protein IIV74_00840 [Alphaproteobacteria bacterium]|nr:hypothetical protein [Alphaproteobacteria bacterium]